MDQSISDSVLRSGPIRLLDVHTYAFEDSRSFSAEYAILSHTWGREEVTLEQWRSGSNKQRAAFMKIIGACEQAKKDGLKYLWVDTCCIDKKNNAELKLWVRPFYTYAHQNQGHLAVKGKDQSAGSMFPLSVFLRVFL